MFRVRRLLHTGADLLTEKEDAKIDAVLAGPSHIAVQVVWESYQRIVASYHQRDAGRGKELMRKAIGQISTGVFKELPELAWLSGTLHRRRKDTLAYYDRTGTSNGPTEAINGRLVSRF